MMSDEQTMRNGSEESNPAIQIPSNGNEAPAVTPLDLNTFSPSSSPQTIPKMDAATFREKAKSFETSASGIVDIATGIPTKLLTWKASGVFDSKSDVKDFVEPTKLSPKSSDACAEALSRIMARRSESSEALDIAILVGAVAEMGIGFAIAWKKLDQIEAKLLAAAKKKEPANDE